MKETKNVFSKDPPATVIQIPAANASRSLTEPLLETHEKGHPQQHQLSSMEPTESDSQSSYGGGDDVTAEATGFKKSNDFDDKPQTLNVSYGGGLLSDLTSNKLDDTVGTFLRHGSMAALLVWMVLLVTALLFTPAESFERLEGVERNANITVLVLLLYTNISRIARMVIRDKGFRFVNSGVMVGYATVQTIAVISISLMVFFPTPVIIDPVTGIRTHLVRWAEWTAAGFLMTFLVESVDLPVSTMEHQHVDKSKRHRNIPMIAWMHGIAIGVSTAAGAVSAFCTSWNAWLAVIGFSWILFCSLFVRLYQRHHRVRNMSPGVCIEEKEDYDRAKYSLKTITVCTLIWTGLAGSWTVIALVTPFVPSESIFSNPALMLVSESLFESISKIWYADLLIEIHEIVFDDAARTMRRLEELRNLMTAVWDHSSDILIWGSRSSRGDSLIQGIVSPRGGDFLGVNSSTPINGKCPSTLLIEVDPDAKQYRCCLVDLSAPITREGAISLRNSKLQEQDKACSFTEFDGNNNVAVIVDLLCEAHCMEFHQEKTTVRNLVSREQGNLRQCEAKISKLASSDSTLIVIRDISERFERFEAEKKLIEEKTARRKDFEANRFTRHEIKNGVLAAIGLVECLKDGTNTNRWSQSIGDGFPDETESITIPIPSTTHTVQRSGDQVRERELDLESISACMDDSYSAGLSAREDSYGELDNTLRDILDTIMDHAMSLDVINGEYDVRKERVDVPFILSNIKRQTTVGPSQRRFQIVSCKEPFPTLGLDPRLLRHIYQNALSNAIRYGKRNGDIQTVIDYDENKREFKMVSRFQLFF
jgi:signal transduction histidine kinase